MKQIKVNIHDSKTSLRSFKTATFDNEIFFT